MAVFDGQRTLLLRHPAPPAEFHEIAPAVWATSGHYPAIQANTATEINGTLTAVSTWDPAKVSVRDQVALMIHETFHVYQRQQHPSWGANEADLIAYPFASEPALLASLQETEALNEALRSLSRVEHICWTAAALKFRSQRFAVLPPESIAYERHSEWNEGLAQYVEERARGVATSAPLAFFGPQEVRRRTYASGSALGRILDDLRPNWRAELNARDRFLDELLSELPEVKAARNKCDLDQNQQTALAAKSQELLQKMQADQSKAALMFRDSDGWVIEFVTAKKGPLFVQKIDPLNMQVVSPKTVVHSRWLTLANQQNAIAVSGSPALTEGNDKHPLFSGVGNVKVLLKGEPHITKTASGLVIEGEGLKAQLNQAAVHRSTRRIQIVL